MEEKHKYNKRLPILELKYASASATKARLHAQFPNLQFCIFQLPVFTSHELLSFVKPLPFWLDYL